jgi:uncharacterized membrane protein YhhN
MLRAILMTAGLFFVGFVVFALVQTTYFAVFPQSTTPMIPWGIAFAICLGIIFFTFRRIDRC